ncbi:hypothetical protein ACIOG4_37210 [Streptomyces microflavus]|uniref:hypothetical protein n=1 Tax=Streptomyces microflavus TaxID=1919 RepID=UPI00382B544F
MPLSAVSTEEAGIPCPLWLTTTATISPTPAAVFGHGQQALETTRTAGLEGLVVKRPTSLYAGYPVPGENLGEVARGRTWLVQVLESGVAH